MGDIAIKVEDLSKEYRLGTIGHGTLREDMQTAWARIRGKEDPNSLVTAKHNIESEKKHFLALDDLNFEIKKGDRVGIIGKNGAGKSTLLKILSRITSPTRGNIYIDGRIGSLLEVGTGFHPELTGRENIYLNGSIMGMKKWEIDKQLDAIIDFSGVERFIDTPIKRYSSGMFVRLGFAVSAHLESEILIVDEVLAVGDAEFQKKALGKMKDVSDNDGRTILFVSHNIGAINSLCTKGILLVKGKLNCYKPLAEVVNEYLTLESVSAYQCDDKKKGSNPYIKSVSILNKEGKEINQHVNGEDLKLQIYSINPLNLKTELTISFWDFQKRPLWNFTHTMHNLATIPDGSEVCTELIFKIPKFTIPEIFVDVAIGPKGGLPFFENVVDAISFSVVDNNEGTLRKVYPEWPIFSEVEMNPIIIKE